MPRVHIILDTTYEYSLWDKAVLDILNSENHLNTVIVPEELLEKYNTLIALNNELQPMLREYYYEQEIYSHTAGTAA